MMRSGSPLPRPASPAISEISVGSPSPPLIAAMHSLRHHNGLTAFRPIGIKRARFADLHNQRSVLAVDDGVALTASQAPQLPQRRKSSAERVKSFSIADILGKRDAAARSPTPSRTPTPTPAAVPLALNKTANASEPALLPVIPKPQPGPAAVLPSQMLSERLAPTVPPSPLVMPPAQLLLDSHALPKSSAHAWQAMRTGAAIPMPLRPFLPPALLHYEQRLAWDYQRQLQEHFQAQAQLLRQMSMDPSIIPSEDGSEHSHSSSAGSECCSPTLSAAPTADGVSTNGGDDKSGGQERKERAETTAADEKAQKAPGDTPLDALFQLSTKNFDDGTDPATLNIFSTRPNPKKKRKSRTAFTNHQIFELEKRFLYQKYLSPADRDEIAASLGLSNAQVITWFQNRRAKLKRDMEELKKDVESVKQLSGHKSFLENVNDLSILKTRPVSRHQQPTISSGMPATLAAASATFNGHTQQSTHVGGAPPHAANIAVILPAVAVAHTAAASQLPAQTQQQQSQRRQYECAASNVSTEVANSNNKRISNLSSDGGSESEVTSVCAHTSDAAIAYQSRLQQLHNSRG